MMLVYGIDADGLRIPKWRSRRNVKIPRARRAAGQDFLALRKRSKAVHRRAARFDKILLTAHERAKRRGSG